MKLAFVLWISALAPAPVADPICLATTIYLEARDQSLEGQLAVAEVALRRLDSGRYGDNLCAVLTAPKQFAMTLRSPNTRIDEWGALLSSAWVTTKAMINWSLPESQRRLVVPGADHFLAYQRVDAHWAAGEPMHIIGDHGFYRVN